MLKTAKEYIDSLGKLKLNIYLMGQKVTNWVDNPIIRPSINCVAATYELAEQPDKHNLITTTSHITGKKINRFTNIHRSIEDLVNKAKMERALGSYTGSCFQRCVGTDALNAMSIVTYNMDQKYNTDYNKRFLSYLNYVQENDLVCDGAMTDAKGDRDLHPAEQADKDQYLRIVDEQKAGIVVRGAKLHQTGAVNSHEIIAMPTRAMRQEDKEYAVAFAIPSDAPGIVYIYGRQSCDSRRLEGSAMDTGNSLYGGQECMIVFDDVFVPWERVFMCKEWEFSGELVEKFATYHRHSYSCKTGVGDVLIGAAQLLAESQGIGKASHVKDKIVEMIHLNETMACCSIACSYEGRQEPSGTYFVNDLWANVNKLNVTRFPYEMARLAQEIAGGALVTLPAESDLKSPEVGRYVSKYLVGKDGVPVENRIRLLRLIENLTLGLGSVSYLTESLHGAGSPQAQRIMISRLARVDRMKNNAARVAGISNNK